MQPHHTTRPSFITLSSRAKNLTGQRFGDLVALGAVARSSHGHIMWFCQCDCGKTTVVRTGNLLSGYTPSCGCRKKERIRLSRTRHGLSDTSIHWVWIDITRRCTDPTRPEYPSYGGRGITICDEWRESFEAFYDHVAALPGFGLKDYSLDRIDNDGNYEPGNVRWATKTEQGRNKRSARLLTFEGRTQCVAAWAEELGVSATVLYGRLRRGWDDAETLRGPLTPRKFTRVRKLNSEDVWEIRRLYSSDPALRYQFAAEKYGVDQSTIQEIVKGTRHANLPNPDGSPFEPIDHVRYAKLKAR